MKAVMIIYNQAHSEKVEYMLEKLGIKGILPLGKCPGQRNKYRRSSPWYTCLARNK